MESVSLEALSSLNRRESASGLVSLEPGREEMSKLKREKNNAHRAWRGFKTPSRPEILNVFVVGPNQKFLDCPL